MPGANAATRALTAATAAGAVPLLRRMRAEFETTGTLSAATTAAMYGCYAGHAAAFAIAARERLGALPLPRRAAAAGGGTIAAAGAGLCVAGMGRFAGAAQISGTDTGELATGGVYRRSRNPQYTGYVALLAGAAVARRSAAALGLAGAAALVFRWWVPVEERHLEREFGSGYARFRERVPRWL